MPIQALLLLLMRRHQRHITLPEESFGATVKDHRPVTTLATHRLVVSIKLAVKPVVTRAMLIIGTFLVAYYSLASMVHGFFQTHSVILILKVFGTYVVSKGAITISCHHFGRKNCLVGTTESFLTVNVKMRL